MEATPGARGTAGGRAASGPGWEPGHGNSLPVQGNPWGNLRAIPGARGAAAPGPAAPEPLFAGPAGSRMGPPEEAAPGTGASRAGRGGGVAGSGRAEQSKHTETQSPFRRPLRSGPAQSHSPREGWPGTTGLMEGGAGPTAPGAAASAAQAQPGPQRAVPAPPGGQPGLTRPSGLRREHGAAWRHGAARAAAPQAANDATPGAGCPNRWRALRLWPRPRPLGGGAPALPRPSARRLAERPRPAAQPYLLARVATWTAAGPGLAGSLGTGNECGVHRRGAARLRPGPRLHGGRWARGGSWWQVGTGQMVPIARADTRCPSQGSWLRTRSRRAPRTLTCPP